MKKLKSKIDHLKKELDEHYRDYNEYCMNWYEPDDDYMFFSGYDTRWYHDYLDDEVGARNRKLNSLLDIENDGPIIYNSKGIVFHPDYGPLWD